MFLACCQAQYSWLALITSFLVIIVQATFVLDFGTQNSAWTTNSNGPRYVGNQTFADQISFYRKFFYTQKFGPQFFCSRSNDPKKFVNQKQFLDPKVIVMKL